MGIYPARSVERAMKFQEVILRAMSKQITWMQAAEILGMSDRNMRRYRNRLEKGGYDGLLDRRTQRPSPKRIPTATVETVLRLYREQYFDFNVRHFSEKLAEEHGIELSYTWIKNALQAAGLVARKRKRGAHHRRRPRRPLPGMMLHVGGSTHAWLGSNQGVGGHTSKVSFWQVSTRATGCGMRAEARRERHSRIWRGRRVTSRYAQLRSWRMAWSHARSRLQADPRLRATRDARRYISWPSGSPEKAPPRFR